MESFRTLRERGARLSAQGRYREAAVHLRKAVALAERRLGPDHADVAMALNELAGCYTHLARFLEAGPLYQRALRILQRRLGPAHQDVATIYQNLGGLEHAAGNWARGEPFARRALRIRARALGRRHPDVAADMTALAALLVRQHKLDEAERLCRRALRILQREHGPRHRLVAATLNTLAAVRRARGARRDAEALCRQTLDIEMDVLGASHPTVASTLDSLAVLVGRQRPSRAEPLFRRALAIFRRALGPRHPNVGVCLEHFAPVLRRLGHRQEALAATKTSAAILSRIEAVNQTGVGLTGTINPERARFDLIVRRSAIHRLGVFAGEPIPTGRTVIEFSGERIDLNEARRRWSPALSYLFGLDDEQIIDGAIGGSGAEYVNHSCDPNLGAVMRGDRLWYVSRRPIGLGEELSVDYKYSGETSLRCRCGASSCRGSLTVKSAPTTRRPRRVSAS